MGDDGVEHEADAAPDEGVAPHEKDELEVGEADAGRRDPHQVLLVLLHEDPGRRQEDGDELQEVLPLADVSPEGRGWAQPFELGNLWDQRLRQNDPIGKKS